MSRLWAVAMVIGIVACHRAPEVEPWPARELGEYSYRTLVGPTSVSGRFTILPDTVTMEAQEQACRRVGTGVRGSPVHYFRCIGGSAAFDVTISSLHPSLSTWSTSTTVKKSTEVCDKYETTSGGERVCKSSHTQVKTETVRNGGPLEIKRLASTGQP